MMPNKSEEIEIESDSKDSEFKQQYCGTNNYDSLFQSFSSETAKCSRQMVIYV